MKEERRTLERFDLHAPTRIEVELAGGRRGIFSLTTKNISSAGTYIATDQPLPEGLPVILELLLSLEMLQRLVGERGRARVRVKGKVIRSDRDGMAIMFESKYKITATNNSVAQ